MKIWTATTEGDNCPITTTVHPSEAQAQNRVLNDLCAIGVGIPEAAMNHTPTIVEIWEHRMDGACLIQEHEVPS